MKKLLLIFVATTMLAACTDKNEPEPFKIDPNAMIYITEQTDAAKLAAQRVKQEMQYEHLSGLEIVKQAKGMEFIMQNGNFAGRGFLEEQRDTISDPPKLMMYSTDVITEYGTLQEDFITSRDVVITTWEGDDFANRDTIAYIPNAILIEAETAIRAAFAAADAEACYELFNEAYRFIPITGEEWRVLKENGEN